METIMSGQIVNLNKFRKQRGKAEKTRKADENAVKFGQSKAERDLNRKKAKKADRLLDGHRRDR